VIVALGLLSAEPDPKRARMIAMVFVVRIVIEDTGEVIPWAHFSPDLARSSHLFDHCLTPDGRICHAWIVPASFG